MTFMWVTHPGAKPPQSPKLLRAVEKQQKLFDSIDSSGNPSSCRICGSDVELTKEHTPSKAAFNKAELIVYSIAEPLVSRFLQWKGRLTQGGSKHKALCRNCNNKTGSWYNPTYVKFAKTCSVHARKENASKILNISSKIYPARLIKEALTHISAISQPGLNIQYPNLRELIIDKEIRLDIQPIKIGLFIRINKGGRQSGVTIFIDTVKETARLIAEFSFWPLGWIVTFDNLSFSGTTDVSDWTSMPYNEKKDLNIDIPCQWCVSPFPGDFRFPEVVFGPNKK